MALSDQSASGRGRYEVYLHYPEGTRCISAVNDLQTAFGDAGAGGEVYDTERKEWVAPELAFDEERP